VGSSSIYVTGNTGIDAVLHVCRELAAGRLTGRRPWPELDAQRKLIAVTAHRRESFGEGFERICTALARLAGRPDVQIYPVHRNPNVLKPVTERLSSVPNLLLIEPLDYVPFVDLTCRAWIIVTDSGGIQEEGTSLGKPILVRRDKTERPEAVETGTVKLVGTAVERVVGEASRRLLKDPEEYPHM